MPDAPEENENRYSALIAKVFFDHYTDGETSFEFDREELVEGARLLGIQMPKNPGDVIYSFRYRASFPTRIVRTAPEGLEWIIEGVGRARYRFRLSRINRIVPREELVTIKIPDATPEIIAANALGDEQALLAKVRYNRLIDIFLGITAYSLQNHLRTSVRGVGQIEVDEIYVGVNRHGAQFVVPVQAKGGTDQIGGTQTMQDIACCAEKFPQLVCRAISAQFMTNDRIALFELTVDEDEVRVVDEKHYQLVPKTQITAEDLARYRQQSGI